MTTEVTTATKFVFEKVGYTPTDAQKPNPTGLHQQLYFYWQKCDP